MTQVRAAALYAGLTLPLAILSHIAAEALALHQSVVTIAASPLHAYLGIVALLCLGASGYGLAAARGNLRRWSGLFANALPFRGKGPQFFAMSAAIQFGFAACTLAGEGTLNAGNALIALVAVALASLVVSALLSVLRERLDDAGAAGYAVRTHASPRRLRVSMPCLQGPYFAYVPAHGNRPPPLR